MQNFRDQIENINYDSQILSIELNKSQEKTEDIQKSIDEKTKENQKLYLKNKLNILIKLLIRLLKERDLDLRIKAVE